MRNEVTVTACQHLPSGALAKQSFPYVLAGSVTARSLTVCVDQKHGMALFKTAMPRFSINSQVTGKSAAWMDECSICAPGGSFYEVRSVGNEVRREKKMSLMKAAGALSKMNAP